MNEEEEYNALQTEVDELRRLTAGGSTPEKMSRMQSQSVLLLYRSNIRLAKSSEQLARRNFWLTVAVLFVAVLQLAFVGFQIWLSRKPQAPIVITLPAPQAPKQ